MTIDIVECDLPKEYLEAAIQATIVGMDIETNGLWPHLGHKTACVQMHVPGYGTVMARRLNRPSNLINLMQSYRVTKIFQYAPFDLSFLMQDYALVQPHSICDTKIAADVLDPDNVMFDHPVEKDQEGNPKKSHSLIALVHHYFGEVLDKETALTDWNAEVLTQRQLAYAAKDVEFLPELLRKLERAIFDKNPLLLNKLHHLYRDLPSKAMARLKQAA